MALRYVRPACIVLLLAAFALDLVTPQLFVAAILLNAPIALSSLALDRRFTQWLIVAALAANLAAGYVNGVAAGRHWDSLAIGDRVICALSFLLVGVLTMATQSSAMRAGELAARQERSARERLVSRAIEIIRSSVNSELIERALAREACAALGADRAWVFAFDTPAAAPTAYAARAGVEEVEVRKDRPAAEILSLLGRVNRDRDPIAIDQADALGRLLLSTFGVESALVVALADSQAQFGVLVIGSERHTFDESTAELLQYFAQQGAGALSRAALFVQLAARYEELERANAALRERSDVIRDIVYALSHDLRTPLAAAGMTMRQALGGAFGALPPAYTEILQRSVASNDELQRLAETLLLVSRYESGDQSTRREPVDLGEVAASIVAELEPLWQEKSIAASVECDARPIVRGDAGELRRAVINLVANAVKFTPHGGAVCVRVDSVAGRASVAVEDTGYGVPQSQQDSLFERLGSEAGGGSGLGLYIVRLIAESHGGTARYAPREGGGSIFTFELPLASGGSAS